MVTERKTVILDFQVDQGSAIQELEKTKKIIIGLQQEQKELNDAYKKGNITLDEYVTEQVRLEAILKKSQNTYSNTQKSVTGVKTSMDKLVESTKNAASQVNIAGVNVGALGARLTALANPVTATVAVVGALGAAYARSTIGAKDLEFASNQLQNSITLLTNDFAKLFSSGEDGEGVFSRLTNSLIKTFSPALAAQSKALALAQEQLEDSQREEIILRQKVNERLEDNQELMTKIQDSQTDINEKTHLVTEIITNLRSNEEDILKTKNEQLKALEKQLAGDQQNEKLQDLVAIKNGEISAIKRDTERKVQSILKLESNLLDTYNKQASALRNQADQTNRKITSQEEADARELANREVSFNDDPTSKEFDPQEQFEKDKELIDEHLGLVITSQEQERAELLRTNAVKEMIAEEDRKRFDESAALMEENFNTLAGLFSQGSEARRLFALAAIGADTAQAISALTAMSESNPANAFTFGGAGIAQYAAGIIRILANIVAAKEFLGGEFAGGGDFVTSKPTMIMVGDNPGGRERVTVEPLSGRGKTTYNPRSGFAKFAGGGSMTFDGNKELAVAGVQQYLQTRNAIKNMPRPIVGVREIINVMEAIEAKENVSTF